MGKATMSGKTVSGTTPAPAVNEQELERIGKETRSMGTADRVHFWDKRQGVKVDAGNGKLVPGPDVIVCPNDKEHGAMIINGQGTLLLCGVSKGGAPCTGSRPVSL